jgi:hypothetical protein
MNAGPAVSAIAHQIQLAVAPVFLLAGIGSILNVLAGRLARVVERARQLERDFDEEMRGAATAELVILDKRMIVVNLALSACTAAALFVCVLVAMLFVAADIAIGRPIAGLFVLAMLLLILGLLLFLWEVRLAMKALRVRRAMMPHRRH